MEAEGCQARALKLQSGGAFPSSAGERNSETRPAVVDEIVKELAGAGNLAKGI